MHNRRKDAGEAGILGVSGEMKGKGLEARREEVERISEFKQVTLSDSIGQGTVDRL